MQPICEETCFTDINMAVVWKLLYVVPACLNGCQCTKSLRNMQYAAYFGYIVSYHCNIHSDTFCFTACRYPTSHQYSEVCTAILQAFPMLRDRVVHEGAGSSQPHVSTDTDYYTTYNNVWLHLLVLNVRWQPVSRGAVRGHWTVTDSMCWQLNPFHRDARVLSICLFICLLVRLSGEAHDTEQSRAMISSDNQQEVLNGFSMNHSWTPPIESYAHHRWQADLEPLHDLCTVVFHICYSAHGCPCWQQNLSTSDRSWTTSLKLRHAVRSLPANADQLWMMAMTLETMAQQNGADVLM